MTVDENRKRADKRRTGRELAAFTLISFANFQIDTTRLTYRIEGLLSSTGLALIWGARKSYKSFMALDVALHIALGRPYRGRRVDQAPVVYIALEGQNGLPARVEALKKHHQVADAPLYLMTKKLNLIASVKALIKDIEQQLPGQKPVVFIDILNRSLHGSEAADKDMSAYIEAAGEIAEHFDTLVVIVHHSGLDGSRPRGHTALSAGVDVQLQCERLDGGMAKLTVELAKDFVEGTEVYSRLIVVDTGKNDASGQKITSLVVEPAEISDAPNTKKKTRGLKDEHKAALNVLDDATIEHGIAAPPSLKLPKEIRRIVTLDHWREQLYVSDILDRDASNPREDFRRIKFSLKERHHVIGATDKYVWKTTSC